MTEPARHRPVRHRRAAPRGCSPPGPRRRRASGEDANAEEDLVRGGYRDRLLVELAQNAADAAAPRRRARPAAARARRRRRRAARGQHRRPAGRGRRAGAGHAARLGQARRRRQRRPVRRRLRRGARGQRRAGRALPRRRACGSAPTAPAPRSPRCPALADELARRGRRRAGAAAAVAGRRARRRRGSPPRWSCRCAAGARDGGRRGAGRSCAPTCCSRCPGWRRRGRRGRRRPHAWRGPAPAAARSGSPTAARTTTWRGGRSAPASCPRSCVADRPVEERARARLDGDLGGAAGRRRRARSRCPPGQVVHAPTPSDEPLSLPARLIAPFPLGPDRRHVLPGRSPTCWSPRPPTPTPTWSPRCRPSPALLAAGAAGRAGRRRSWTRALGAAVLDRLRADRLAAGRRREARRAAAARPAPRRSTRRPTSGSRRSTGVLPGLLPAGWSRRSDAPGADRARRPPGRHWPRRSRRCAACSGPAAWWAALYAALDGADREELAALPVPLADGRTAHGPAGVLLPDAGAAGRPAGPARPAAGRPRRRSRPPAAPAAAGAARRAARRPRPPCSPTPPSAPPSRRRWTPSTSGRRRTRSPGSWPTPCWPWSRPPGPSPGSCRGWPSWRCPTPTGGWAPAGELVLPGSPLAAVLAEGALGALDAGTARRRPIPTALRAVGVLDTFALVRAEDPDELDVDGAEDWADAVLDRLPPDAPPPEWPPLTAVRDLELVRDWRRALPLLAALPGRGAGPTSSLGGVAVPGYLRWWLRDPPGARRPAARPAAAPGQHGVTGTVRSRVAAIRACWTLLRPPGHGRRRAGRRRRRDRPARPARRPGAHGRGRTCCGRVYARLAAALDGVDVEPAGAGPGGAGPGRRRTPSSSMRRRLQPLVDLPVVPAGGAPGAGRRPARPAAGERAGAAGAARAPAAARRPGRGARRRRWPPPGSGSPELDRARSSCTSALDRRAAGAVAWWPGDATASTHVDGSPGRARPGAGLAGGRWSLRQALAEAFAEPERGGRAGRRGRGGGVDALLRGRPAALRPDGRPSRLPGLVGLPAWRGPCRGRPGSRSHFSCRLRGADQLPLLVAWGAGPSRGPRRR